MSDALKLALEITATDLAGGVLKSLRDRIVGTGDAAKQVQRDFDDMINHIQTGMKSLAVGKYFADKMKPGIDAAADLQESLLRAQSILWDTGESAGSLADKMKIVRSTALDLVGKLPYSAKQIADTEANLLQGGITFDAVTKGGATYSTLAMAKVAEEDPAQAAIDIAKIGHAWQMTGDGYTDLENVMAKLFTHSGVRPEELIHNLEMAGSNFHLLGISPEQAAIATATMAPAGDEAGSYLNNFIVGLAGGGRRGSKEIAKLGLDFFDKDGKFKGLVPSIHLLRAKMATLNEQQKIYALNHLFGQQGFQAARYFLQEGSQGFEWHMEAAEHAADLQRQINMQMQGFNQQMDQLKNVWQALEINIWTPMIEPLTEVVRLTRELTHSAGEWSGKHPGTMGAAGVVGGGVAAGLGLAALGYFAKGAFSGARMLAGLKGMGGTAIGVAEGKALQAAAGVTPVFVTNASQISGGGSVAAAAEGAAQALKLSGVVGALLKIAGKGIGAASKLGFAYEAGHFVGSEINDHLINGTELANKIGKAVTLVAAGLGNEEAKAALADDLANVQSAALTKALLDSRLFGAQGKGEFHLKIDVQAKDGTAVKVIPPMQAQHTHVTTTTNYVTAGGGSW